MDTASGRGQLGKFQKDVSMETRRRGHICLSGEHREKPSVQFRCDFEKMSERVDIREDVIFGFSLVN